MGSGILLSRTAVMAKRDGIRDFTQQDCTYGKEMGLGILFSMTEVMAKRDGIRELTQQDCSYG
jgi:hypothetical protein